MDSPAGKLRSSAEIERAARALSHALVEKKGTEPTDKEIGEVFDKLMAKTNAMRAGVRGKMLVSPLPDVAPEDESSLTSKPTGPG
jgi:hypothetical protein